jgi:hypothetical protein
LRDGLDRDLRHTQRRRIGAMIDDEATVTEEELVRYVEIFLDEYRTAVEALLDSEVRQQLVRYPYLHSRVIAYVSSSSGVAINYVAAAEELSVEGWSGPKRAEDFLLSVPDELRGKSSVGIGMGSPGKLTLRDVGFSNLIPMTMGSEEAEVILVDVKSEIGLLSSSIRYASYMARRALQGGRLNKRGLVLCRRSRRRWLMFGGRNSSPCRLRK